MDEPSKIESPIIVTISCTDEVRAGATLNPDVVRSVFRVNVRHLDFPEELGSWWMRVKPDHASYEDAKQFALAGMTFLASEQGVSDESWINDVRLVVLGRSLETGLRSMRDLFVELFPNAEFHGGRFGDASKRIWGEDFVGTDIRRGEPAAKRWFEDILIDELGLDVRPYQCLRRVGLDTIGLLVDKTEEDLRHIPNFGQKSLDNVVEKLGDRNLKLADS